MNIELLIQLAEQVAAINLPADPKLDIPIGNGKIRQLVELANQAISTIPEQKGLEIAVSKKWLEDIHTSICNAINPQVTCPDATENSQAFAYLVVVAANQKTESILLDISSKLEVALGQTE